jgi:hypothetical protein
MALPHYAKGFTYPGLGRGVELSAVRCPCPLGVVYVSGLLGEDRMDPTLAQAWVGQDDGDPNIYVHDFKIANHPDGRRAAAAVLRTFIRDEEIIAVQPHSRVNVTDIGLRALERAEGPRAVDAVRAGLSALGFRECYGREGGLVAYAAPLVTDLESEYPQLINPVPIPNLPVPEA